MYLTDEQQAILNGAKGETMAKVMKTLVMYGDAFEAEKLVPITSDYNHLVTSFGLKVMSPVYDLMQQLLDAGVVSGQKFSVDPRPIDKNVPANFLQNFVFNKFMYTKQDFYEKQLNKLEDVLDIKILEHGFSVKRELILVKIRATDVERQSVISVTEIFRGNIIDVASDSMIIELVGNQDKLEAFLGLLEGYEILELARTGITGLTRGSSDVKFLD